MTSSRVIAQALNVRCTGGHDHVPLVGGRAAGAAIYPKMLCEAIITDVIKQKAMDASSLVDTVKMDKGQLSLFCQWYLRRSSQGENLGAAWRLQLRCQEEWHQSTGWEVAH